MFFRKRPRDIAPDEIFLDASNLPGRDEMQFEARVVKPLERRAILGVGVVFGLIAFLFVARAFELGIVHGETYAEVSRENRLLHSVVFAPRGIMYDRTGRQLAWSELSTATSTDESPTTPYPKRTYIREQGFSHLLGFVRYPKQDASGNWWREETSGVSGSELAFDEILRGENGALMVESDARGNRKEQNIVLPVEKGHDLTLAIDAELQAKLYEQLSAHAARQGFVGGAGIIMDVRTGELLALTSFPEYDNARYAEGEAEAIAAASDDPATPLLNRAISGLYVPGSIVKPIFAAAALAEAIISPDKEINSTGAITIPNPYNPELPSIFRDWRAHGLVDMREALAVSSDEYFYTIGGGYGSQVGLGIRKLDDYARRFGLGDSTGVDLLGEKAGVIPTPEWKEEVFGPDDPWRIGNTYHTSIGQYGFQITPIQAVRFAAAIANGGKLLVPQLLAHAPIEYESVDISDAHLQIVREGMRLAVTSTHPNATVKSLQIPGIAIAGKTGTAEIGSEKQWINSWAIGFWPHDNPKYAFAVVLEKAPAGTLSGAAPGLRPFFEWLVANKSEYSR